MLQTLRSLTVALSLIPFAAACSSATVSHRSGAPAAAPAASSGDGMLVSQSLGLDGYDDLTVRGTLVKGGNGDLYVQVDQNPVVLDVVTNDFASDAAADIGKVVTASGYMADAADGSASKLVVEDLSGADAGLDLAKAAKKPRPPKQPNPAAQPHWNCVASVVYPLNFLFDRFNGQGPSQTAATQAALSACHAGAGKNAVCILPPSIFPRGTIVGNFTAAFGGCGYFDGKHWHVY